MKIAIWGNVVVSLLFAVAPWISLTAPYLTPKDPSDAFGTVVTIVSVLYGFVSTILLVGNSHERQSLKELREAIERQTRGPVIAACRDDEFYAAFLTAARAARHTVLICYFGSQSPSHALNPERRQYYTAMLRTMQNKQEVSFRRLLRDTSANRAWAAERLNDWKGLPNVSVALLVDSDESIDMPLSLSVQVVDDHTSWLVAVSGHDRTGPHRDLKICDNTATQFLVAYFERLWSKADKIVDSGNLTTTGESLENPQP